MAREQPIEDTPGPIQGNAALSVRLSRGPLLMDAALGTALLAINPKGLPVATWLTQHPQAVLDIHHSHRKAGARVLHTHTFRAGSLALPTDSSPSMEELNHLAVDLARQAAGVAEQGEQALVSGCIGPTGLGRGASGPESPLGDPAQIKDAIASQAEVLIEAGVDCIGLETFGCALEAAIALDAVRGLGRGVEVSVCLTLGPIGPTGEFITRAGQDLGAAVSALDQAGCTALGVNCNTSAEVLAALPTILANTSLPVMALPNAGKPRKMARGWVYDQSPEEWSQEVLQAVTLGARAVGGCCGTGPEQLVLVRQQLEG